jgi:GntR family transcriptional regulator of arabinose operon
MASSTRHSRRDAPTDAAERELMPRRKSEPEALHEPAHRRIYAEIVRAIARGQYGPGTQLPGEATLAMKFGVSRGTLRQALANLRQDGFVEAVPGRGSFVRKAVPVRRDDRRRVVGVVVPSVSRPALLEVLTAIEDELHRRAYSMLVASSGNTAAQEAGRVRRIVDEGVSGLIVHPIDDPDTRIYEHFIDESFPVMLFDRHIVGLAIDAVLPDNVGGAYAAVSHLIERGHRRIAFVSSDNLATSSVQERLAGYEQALRAHALEPDVSLRFTELPAVPPQAEDHHRVTMENAQRVQRFLRRAPRPTAVFALHDRIALSVVEAASSIGLRIPEDLAVVGFDDDPLVQSLGVTLTSVAQPREEMGRMAARLIADRIEGRRAEVARIVLPTRLVVRHSSEAKVIARSA